MVSNADGSYPKGHRGHWTGVFSASMLRGYVRPVVESGTWYYHDANAKHGDRVAQPCGTQYYLRENGAMATGWRGGTWYSGRLRVRWRLAG